MINNANKYLISEIFSDSNTRYSIPKYQREETDVMVLRDKLFNYTVEHYGMRAKESFAIANL